MEYNILILYTVLLQYIPVELCFSTFQFELSIYCCGFADSISWILKLVDSPAGRQGLRRLGKVVHFLALFVNYLAAPTGPCRGGGACGRGGGACGRGGGACDRGGGAFGREGGHVTEAVGHVVEGVGYVTEGVGHVVERVGHVVERVGHVVEMVGM